MKSASKSSQLVVVVAFAAFVFHTNISDAQPANEPMAKYWRPDGPVYAISVQGNTVYIGVAVRLCGTLDRRGWHCECDDSGCPARIS